MTQHTPINAGDITQYMNGLAQDLHGRKSEIRLASHEARNDALMKMATALEAHQDTVLAANKIDYAAAEQKGLSGAMLDRLTLTPARIMAIAESLRSIASLPDPVGTVDKSWQQPNGLEFSQVRTPIGLIGIIYESRPNVTADAAGLCIKSGNAFILRGGSESYNSSNAIFDALKIGASQSALKQLPGHIVQTTDRNAVGQLLSGLDGRVDLIIPRGGKSLVARVQQDARVPVLSHLDGLCHTYIHSKADLVKAKALVLNAKMRRTGICGATETVLVDAAIAKDALAEIIPALQDKGCECRVDKAVQAFGFTGTISASDTDFHTEHLAPIVNIAVVADIDAAIAHIDHYGSAHTDCIVTEDESAAQRFLSRVDSAIVMHNTSTQFADGGEFGFGAEIGIATGRLHARGPVGAQHLTTYKYQVIGSGQVRP
jgi:glutamate-5-semialdehyde dehydrogenase